MRPRDSESELADKDEKEEKKKEEKKIKRKKRKDRLLCFPLINYVLLVSTLTKFARRSVYTL